MELGSEFPLGMPGKFCEDNIFHYLRKFDTLYVDSGRSALRQLENKLRPGNVLLPSYICDSVYACFQPTQVRFYKLIQDLQLDWDSLFQQLNKDVSTVYLHYFNGVLPDKNMLLKLRNARMELRFQIIEDTTHSIFSSPLTVGDYGVCSLRKWFPIPDGGVIYGRDLNGLSAAGEAPWVQKKADAMRWKYVYLSGQGSQDSKTTYRKMFAECDQTLNEQQNSYQMSAISKDILAGCSISQMISARKANAARVKEVLSKELSWMRPLAWPKDDECPLTLPVKVQDRDSLRAYLVSKKIYCAIHWPLRGTPMEVEKAVAVSDQELSLPIDQRYGTAEIEYLVNCLRCYGREIYAATNHKR